MLIIATCNHAYGAQCKASDGNWYDYNSPQCNSKTIENDVSTDETIDSEATPTITTTNAKTKSYLGPNGLVGSRQTQPLY
jgi:hypothetical protein